jgi:hypothetical protein
MSGWRREGCRITASPDLNTLFPASANLCNEPVGPQDRSGPSAIASCVKTGYSHNTNREAL